MTVRRIIPSSKPARHRLMMWFGLALGLGLCLFFLVRMDWAAFFDHLRGLNPWPVLAMLAVTTLSCTGRAARWRLLARGSNCPEEVARRTGLIRFWRSVVIGYLGNYVYPARAGEVLRMVYLNKATRLPAARVLTSSLIDRGLDVLLVAGCAAVLAWHGLFAGEAAAVLPYLGLGVAAAVIGLAVLLRHHAALRAVTRRLLAAFWPRRQAGLLSWMDQMMDAVLLLRSPGVLTSALGYSLGVIALDGLAIWLLLLAFGWDLPITAGLTLYVFLTLGAALPAAPGYLGVYQAVAVLVLTSHGIPEAGALAFAFTLQGLSLCLFLGLFLALGGVSARLR